MVSQVSAMHLVSASLMSAPAALVMSKLISPEIETPTITYPFIAAVKGEYAAAELLIVFLNLFSAIVRFITHRRYENVVHAMSSGAIDGVGIVVGAVANIIVCIAALEFFNVTIAWIGARVLLPFLSFEVLYL